MYPAAEAHNAWERVRLFNECFTGHYGHSIAISADGFKNDRLPLLEISEDAQGLLRDPIADSFARSLPYGEIGIDFASEDIISTFAMYNKRLLMGAMTSGYKPYMPLYESFERNLKQAQSAWTRWANIERWRSDIADDFAINPIMPWYGKQERLGKEQFYGRHIPAMVNFILMPFMIALYATAYQAIPIAWVIVFTALSVLFNQSICTHLLIDKIKDQTETRLMRNEYRAFRQLRNALVYLVGSWEGIRLFFGRTFLSLSGWWQTLRQGINEGKMSGKGWGTLIGAIIGAVVASIEFLLPIDLIRRTLLFAGYQMPINIGGYI
jgi:hypothetical protein